MKLIYQGKVNTSGDLKIHDRQRLYSELSIFRGEDVIIEISKKVKKRTNPQNAYYWAIVVPLITEGLQEVGYQMTRDETHEWIKNNFALEEVVNKETGEILLSEDGSPMKVPMSTTRMTTTEFGNLIDALIIWAKEFLNVEIPEPDTQAEIKYNFDKTPIE